MNTPDQQKDWDEGAIMLLQLSGNKIMYANISHNPKGKAEFIKGKLQRYLNFRLQDLTKQQVKEMQQKVDVIVKDTIKPAFERVQSQGNLNSAEREQARQIGKPDGDFADFKAGKRGDHDLLPDVIKALYAENLDIVHRMRELHLKLRTLSLENATCPDSERYPFLKEIIALDKKLHENWDAYDHFVVGNPVPDALKADVSPEAPADESPESQSENTEASECNGATGTQSESEGQTETVAETVATPKKAKATAKRTQKTT